MPFRLQIKICCKRNLWISPRSAEEAEFPETGEIQFPLKPSAFRLGARKGFMKECIEAKRGNRGRVQATEVLI